MTFDLASLDTRTRAQSGVPMQLIHPRDRGPVRTDAGELVTVTLHGRASDIYRNAERAMQERRAERRARGVITTQDEFARDETELLAACTVAWNIPELDGQLFAYSDDNARRLWSDTRFAWLRDQAIGFIQADGNFFASLTARLLEWAEHDFRLSRPQADGQTLRDAYASFKRQSGFPHPKDKGDVECPDEAIYLLNWFWEMSMGRTVTEKGCNPLSPRDITDWCGMRNIKLRQWEVTTIIGLEMKFRKVMGEP